MRFRVFAPFGLGVLLTLVVLGLMLGFLSGLHGTFDRMSHQLRAAPMAPAAKQCPVDPAAGTNASSC